MKLGRCLDLTEITPTVGHSGAATVTWTATDATHGELKVVVEKGFACPGGSGNGGVGGAIFQISGCGKIRVSVTGEGGGGASDTSATVNHVRGGVPTLKIDMEDETGGTICETVGLVPVSGESSAEFKVRCGDYIDCDFSNLVAFGGARVECTFELEVLEQ